MPKLITRCGYIHLTELMALRLCAAHWIEVARTGTDDKNSVPSMRYAPCTCWLCYYVNSKVLGKSNSCIICPLYGRWGGGVKKCCDEGSYYKKWGGDSGSCSSNGSEMSRRYWAWKIVRACEKRIKELEAEDAK